MEKNIDFLSVMIAVGLIITIGHYVQNFVFVAWSTLFVISMLVVVLNRNERV